MSNQPRNRSERSSSQPELGPPTTHPSASGLKEFAIEFSLNVGTDLGQTTGKMAQTAIADTFKQAAIQQGLPIVTARSAMALPYALVTVKTVGVGHVDDGHSFGLYLPKTAQAQVLAGCLVLTTAKAGRGACRPDLVLGLFFLFFAAASISSLATPSARVAGSG